MSNADSKVRQAAPAQRIRLTEGDVRRMEALWTSRWRREPTPLELQGLLEEEVREEILYREALTLDLDKNDMVIKRFLAQKVGMMVADLAAMRKQDPAEVRAWFERNLERFAQPPRASFRHLYFSFDLRPAHAHDDATAALANLTASTTGPTPDDQPGDPFVFQSFYGDRTEAEVGQVFGRPFAEALFQLDPGTWQGPVESAYGWHLVWIDSLTPGRTPAFEEIEQTIHTEWLAEQRANARNKFYEFARKKYQVEVPEGMPSLSRFKPMSSAQFVYREDGSPDWGSMWTTFCDLALYGGPPHRGEANALTAPAEPPHDWIGIRRGRCSVCGRTFTFLPLFSLPYTHYSLPARCHALQRRFAEQYSWEKALPNLKDSDRLPDPSTVRRWSSGVDCFQVAVCFLNLTVMRVAHWLARGHQAVDHAGPPAWVTPALQLLWPLRL